MKTRQLSKQRSSSSRRRHNRNGGVLIWCAFLLIVLIGMIGMVVDAGILIAEHRIAHNAADAAATAAAFARFQGQSDADAIAQGTLYVTGAEYNGDDPELAAASVSLNIPPTAGPYSGNSDFVEAIVSYPTPTYFIHFLANFLGGAVNGAISARAVAGGDTFVVGAGVMALDKDATPGFDISGTANFCVDGAVFVNSTGGGEDEWGENVANGQSGSAVSNNATACAGEFFVAGGVNNLENFQSYPLGGPSPLDAGTGECYPDPYIDYPTPLPLIAYRGSPQATNGGLQLNNPDDEEVGEMGPNFIEFEGSPDERMVLHPGIYNQITITGGRVRFVQGLYVLSPQSNLTWALDITGGDVEINNVTFYNTCSNFDPLTGLPDSNDGETPPPSNFPTPGIHCGGVKINASIEMTDVFFHFRKWNTSRMQIEGNSDDGDLTGAVYAKWSEVTLAGQGTLNMRIVAGEIDVAGTADVFIDPEWLLDVELTRVFLVD